MIVPIALVLLAIHPTAPDSARASRDPAVRVWLSDSVLDIGQVAQVFVRPRYNGYLMVLHADAEGHIRVLYPVSPADQIPVAAGATFQVSGGVEGRAFSVNAKGTGMILAAWSAAPFSFDDLRYRDQWDYETSLLFQPSAGSGFAALLDIADRIAGDRPYGYDLAVYGTPGALARRPTAPPKPCDDCLTKHYVSRSSDNTVAAAGYAVDCSNTTLVDSFCGVSDNRVYYSYVDNSQNYYEDQSQTNTYPSSSDYPYYSDYGSYYPYYDYGHVGHGHFRRGDRIRSTTPAQAYIRPLGLRQVPGGRGGGGSPMPPSYRWRPTISVRQPYAPSRPNLPVTAAPATSEMGSVVVARGARPGGPGTDPRPGDGAMGGWGSGGLVGAGVGGGAAAARSAPAPNFGNRIPQSFGNTIPQPFGNTIGQSFGGGVPPAPPRAAQGSRGGEGGGRRR